MEDPASNDEDKCQLSEVDRISRGSLQMLLTGADRLMLPVLLVSDVNRVEFVSDDGNREFRMQLVLFDGISKCNHFYLYKQSQSEDVSRTYEISMHSVIRLKRFEQAQIGSRELHLTVINTYELLVPGKLLEDRDDDRLIQTEVIGIDKSCSKEELWDAIQAAESRILTHQVESVDAIDTLTCDCAAFWNDKQLLGYTNNRKFATISDDRQRMQLSVDTYSWLLGGLRRTHTIASLCESVVHMETITRQPVVLRVRLTCLTEPINRRFNDSTVALAGTHNKSLSFTTSKRIGNMRFADETGELKAIVFEEELDAAYSVLAPGGIYLLVAPRVELVTKRQFTSCTSRFDLLIGRETRIVSVTSDPFLFYLLPVATFNFLPFDALASVRSGQHVDVVGFITRVHVEAPNNHSQSATSLFTSSVASSANLRVKFLLEDETGYQILVTLFDQLAVSFNDVIHHLNSRGACSEPHSEGELGNMHCCCKGLIVALRDVRLWRASVCGACGAAACSVKSTPSSTAYFRADLIGPRFNELRRCFASSERAHKKHHAAALHASQAASNACSVAADNELFNEHNCDLLSTRSNVSLGPSVSPCTSLRDVSLPFDTPAAKRSRPIAYGDGDGDSGFALTASAHSLDHVNYTYNYHYVVETPRDIAPSRSLIARVFGWLASPFRALLGSGAEAPRGAPSSLDNCQTEERLFQAVTNRNGVLAKPDDEAALTRCSNVGELLARARRIVSAMQKRDEDTLLLTGRLFEVAFRIERFTVHRTVDSASDLVHLIVTDAEPDYSTAPSESTASIFCDDVVAHALFGAAYGLLTPKAAEFDRLTTANWSARRIFRCVVFPVHQRSTGSLAFVAHEAAQIS